jgi:hypothetical protein
MPLPSDWNGDSVVTAADLVAAALAGEADESIVAAIVRAIFAP